MGQSILKSQRSQGILSQMSPLGQKNQRKRNSDLGFSLNLTTLIDAFCILVIFLLSNMNGQTQQVDLAQQISLPEAQQNELIENGFIVQIQNNEISIDKVKLRPDQVPAHLMKLKSNLEAKSISMENEKKYESLIIQADKSVNFEMIGDLLRAAGQAGFSKYVFAVWPKTK